LVYYQNVAEFGKIIILIKIKCYDVVTPSGTCCMCYLCCVYSAIGSLVYSYIKYAEQQEERNKKLKLNGELKMNEERKDSHDNKPLLPPPVK